MNCSPTWGQGGVRNTRRLGQDCAALPSPHVQVSGVINLKELQTIGRKEHLSCSIQPGNGVIPPELLVVVCREEYQGHDIEHSFWWGHPVGLQMVEGIVTLGRGYIKSELGNCYPVSPGIHLHLLLSRSFSLEGLSMKGPLVQGLPCVRKFNDGWPRA